MKPVLRVQGKGCPAQRVQVDDVITRGKGTLKWKRDSKEASSRMFGWLVQNEAFLFLLEFTL